MDWAHKFINLLQQFSPSELRLPKLHSWLYHIDHSIREFGPLNGLCTETYETLHKYYVKAFYRRSNKRNINSQLLKNVSKTVIFLILNFYIILLYSILIFVYLFLKIRCRYILATMHDNDTNNNLQSQSSNITFGKKIYQFKLEDINTFTQQFYCNMAYSDELQL